MGSKTIILLGVLLSALYLYFCVSKYAAVTPIVQSVVETEVVEQVVVSPEPIIPEKVDVSPAIVEEDKVVDDVTDRISIPAFGFMTGLKKNQIVALMSNNDESGLLSKYIEELCQKSECSKDMRYESDIINAQWQEEAVKIINLLTDGSIENGSLFIESNILKLEGTINNQKTKDILNRILNTTKSDKFKVENHTTLLSNIPMENSEIKEIESSEKEVVIEKVEPKPVPKPKVEKVIPKPIVSAPLVSTPEISVKAVMDTTLDTQSQITVEHSIDENIPDVGVVAKPSTKIKKRVLKRTSVSKPEVIPAPVMETTLDAEARVRAILSEIKDSGPEVGVVAKPYMETTAE